MSATPRGDLPRNEGRRNYPYGPTVKHARKSVLNRGSNTYDKYGAARLRQSQRPTCPLHPTYEGKKAPRSKAAACTCRAIYEYVRTTV